MSPGRLKNPPRLTVSGTRSRASACRGVCRLRMSPTCSAMMKDGARALLALVPERQARLTKILKDAFGDKSKLTAIQGGRA